ncbi:MAG: glycosyltransferase family 1 protein [Candidatus Stahlbacteria bacterium]|jgi:phosphatidylinositol alpha-mannosyltransferase|nr:MAG: glycosyltransferase family 1 protein [Candidatus Stahlbacteria bacterium]
MRVLQVSDSYYPDPGGVSEVLFHLSHALKSLGHEVVILTSRHPKVKNEEIVKRVGWRIKLQANKSEVIWTFSPSLPFEVRNFIRENSFDVIHTHGPFAPNLPFLALLYSDAVNVATFHSAFTGFNYYKLAKFAFTSVSKKLHGSICVSKKALCEIYPHFPKGNYRIIPNGVDANRFKPEGEKIKDFSDSNTILFLGRLDPRKGLPILIKAFPAIKKAIPDTKLVVVGRGQPPKDIPPEVKDSILFKGEISPEMVPVYYRSANLYCSPALGGETFGIVLLEAMASGVPAIASDIEGYREVIPNKEMLFRKGDPHDLANKAITILKDDSLKEKIREIGLDTAKRYNWINVARETESFYKTLSTKS